jgi:hypothetical protein
MTFAELRDWQRFESDNRRPLPDILFDVHLATLTSTLVNVMTSRTEPARAADYMVLRDRTPAIEEGLTDIDAIGAALDRMQGGG